LTPPDCNQMLRAMNGNDQTLPFTVDCAFALVAASPRRH
jgi:hypothetical protein